MGVRGLCKFVDENPHLYKPFKLHDTRVIMDGSNLVHYLYTYSKADFMFGGNYGEYADSVKKYFASFKACNVEAIVIFDGASEETERSLQKSLRRNVERLEKIKSIIEEAETSDTFLPINAEEVFKEILSEIGIKFARCDYEGDNQMAALANDYECPLLSDDSDFYIYNLRKGFIRLSHVDTCVKTDTDRNGTILQFLKCKIYYVDTLLYYFPLKDPHVLHLLATLAGNDYSCYDDFKSFFSKIDVYPREKFIGLLSWLSSYSLKNARDKVLSLTEEERRDYVENLIETSLADYQLKPTNLRSILEDRTLKMDSEFTQKTKIAPLCGTIFPEQFVTAYHKGIISSSFLNIINLHRKLLKHQVEDFSNLSSYTSSRYIRQITYSILLQHDSENSEKHVSKCLRNVDEYDRVNDRVEPVCLELLTKLKNGKHIPELTEVYDVENLDLQDFLASVLGVDKTFFGGIPKKLQLFFGCTNYWLHNCSTKPTKEFLYALLLGVIYYQVKEVTIPEINSDSKDENKPNIFQNAWGPYTRFVIQDLGEYLHQPIQSPSNPLDLHIVHSYNELQACILATVRLNSLIRLPFDSPKLHEIIAGTMLYNLTKVLLSSPHCGVFIEYMLGKETALINLFNTMKHKVLDRIPSNYFEKKFSLENFFSE